MKQNTFKTWSAEENLTWKKLAARQLPNLKNRISQIWSDGFAALDLPMNKVPDFTKVSQKLQTLSGWSLTSTQSTFASGDEWFNTLNQRKLLITQYIRPLDSLDYTPMPDVWHDAFGHLPFMASPRLAQVVADFTTALLSATPKQRKKLGRIWWYTIEFGLIKEKGQVKVLGAGLASSFGELNLAFSGKVKLSPFDPKKMSQVRQSPSAFHAELFILESLSELENFLSNWRTQI